jgi:hypothetical protein
MARDDTAALEHMEEPEHGIVNDTNPAVTLVAAPCDDQHFLGAIDLLLPEPCLGARDCGCLAWQTFSKIQRAGRAKPRFIERLTKPSQVSSAIRTAHARLI